MKLPDQSLKKSDFLAFTKILISFYLCMKISGNHFLILLNMNRLLTKIMTNFIKSLLKLREMNVIVD